MDKSMAKLIAILQVNTYYLLHIICKYLPCPLDEAKEGNRKGNGTLLTFLRKLT